MTQCRTSAVPLMLRRFLCSGLMVTAVALVPSPGQSDPACGWPDPVQSQISDRITILPDYQDYPGPTHWNEVIIVTGCGVGVVGAQVDIVFDESDLFCWCVGQGEPVVSDFTDGSGYTYFEIYGGGCADIGRTVENKYPARVLADGIQMRRVQVNSPDVVDNAGVLATDGWNPGGTCAVKGNDASWHTQAIVNNLVEPCSKFDQDAASDDPVGATDATILTPFIVANSNCAQP